MQYEIMIMMWFGITAQCLLNPNLLLTAGFVDCVLNTLYLATTNGYSCSKWTYFCETCTTTCLHLQYFQQDY